MERTKVQVIYNFGSCVTVGVYKDNNTTWQEAVKNYSDDIEGFINPDTGKYETITNQEEEREGEKMKGFTKREIERIKEADTMAAYVKALTPKNREALKNIMNPGKVEKTETLAEYIQRTGCKTEERTSKRGVVLIKVYFENGKIAEYEKKHINTTTAF